MQTVGTRSNQLKRQYLKKEFTDISASLCADPARAVFKNEEISLCVKFQLFVST